MRSVVLPPPAPPHPTGSVPGGWWHETSEPGRIICDLCPRECSLKPGDRGFCFVRQNIDGAMQLTTYGRSTGFCIDPIEKKPLNHFYPGTPILSFGTAGCNLGCKFCQNWDISKSREVEKLSELALPDMIAAAAVETGCRSVAYTYNDPVIWAEYAIDTARACRTRGIKSVAVTAGYISPEARPAFFREMDAANVDLKAFTESFYQQITYSHLQPVLDTLRWLKHESDVWFEITNLMIPDANDSPDEIRRMSDWIVNEIGPDIPVHFTAFHPDFRMQDRPPTPRETLLTAKDIAQQQGLNFVYVGNVNDVRNQSTWCPSCGTLLIERDWHLLGTYQLKGNRCGNCDRVIPGHFDDQPGDWGRKRVPVHIGRYRGDNSPSATGNQAAADTSSAAAESRSTAVTHRPAAHSTGETAMIEVTECPQLTTLQESAIHRAACEIVAAAVHQRPVVHSDPALAETADTTIMGVFVTLRRDGNLRGCCGTLGQPMKLLKAMNSAAYRTALDDPRFPRVSPEELPWLTLDITLLHNFEEVTEQGESRVDAIEVGRHGLRIQRGSQAGLLLPSVAVEYGWDAATFLHQVCRKAGLHTSAWREPDTQLMRFEGRMVEGPFAVPAEATSAPQLPQMTADPAIPLLAKFAASNIRALLSGAVPGCFPSDCEDGTVDGIALRFLFPETSQHVTFSRLQLRGGYPLQTTLLSLTQAAAEWMKRSGIRAEIIPQIRLDLALFSDPAAHGMASAPDLRGVDSRRRALVLFDGSRIHWTFHETTSPEEQLSSLLKDAEVDSPATTAVYSCAVRSTAPALHNPVPPPKPSGGTARRPAVAGRFYPGDGPGLQRLVDQCLSHQQVTPEAWPAVMVPHAGLQYSGRIAAQVLQHVVIPETVIVIGPKHTALGVEWAVAPHTEWEIPGGRVKSDPELAARLAASIEGLQLDAAAHAQEHAIEVELPLLARLAPDSRVVGLAIGRADLGRCLRFGQQLAEFIASLPAPPLLVISSDMNHFATDSENRRLDEMALKAMESLDPATLYHTVASNDISMCGVLPAVIVMEALRRRQQLSRIRRCGYATSGDVTGDKSRVVGYAGMLLG